MKLLIKLLTSMRKLGKVNVYSLNLLPHSNNKLVNIAFLNHNHYLVNIVIHLDEDLFSLFFRDNEYKEYPEKEILKLLTDTVFK